MARPKSASPGTRFEVTLSEQSVALLKKLAVRGIYGRTPSEVGGGIKPQGLK
jgi:hypothetical protein